jgi:TPR repeat protein
MVQFSKFKRRDQPCGLPGKGHKVNAKNILWIAALAVGFIMIDGNTVWASEEDDKLLKFCNEGNSVACFKQGKRYVTLDKDTKKAIPLFRKSCAADHMGACIWGGNLIQNTGKQYSPQWKEASKMFKKACEADEDGACVNLGSLYYREGRASKAKKLYKKACDMGNKIGCHNLKELSD